MSAFFFGPPDRQLFGFHHVPRGTPAGAVVLCPSWATEYQYSHRSLNVLGRRLAGAGFHVLRFDYSGTGDSWGDSRDVDLDRWIDDLREAATELRTMSGTDHVDLVGLRLGAWVAARALDGMDGSARSAGNAGGAGGGLDGVRRVVFWDPVIDGNAWVDELRIHGEPGAEDEVELNNAIVPRRFVDQLRAIRPDGFGRGAAERVLLLATQEDADYGAMPEIEGMEQERMVQPAPWVEDESIWTGQVPVQAVGRITEWLR